VSSSPPPARSQTVIVGHPEDLDTEAVVERLGDLLVKRGVVSSSSLTRALAARADAPPSRRRIGHLLVDRGLASETDVARALADLLDLPFVDLAAVPADDALARSIPRAVAEAHGLLVLRRHDDGTVQIGTHDPKNVVGLDDARLHTQATQLDVVVVAEGPMRARIEQAWDATEGARAVGETVRAIVTTGDDEDEGAAAAEDAPIVRLAGRLLADAMRARASDIHIEPQRDDVRVRYRIDGVLREVARVPLASRAALTSRLKLIAGMDIAERRVPQDGRVRLEIGDRAVDTRVSTLPSMFGEKVVIRLLTPAESIPELEDLGMRPRDLLVLRRALAQPQGLVLITGPTGSGKTSTLFSALREVNAPERNIVTLEDPVEIQLPGLTQVQINERTGMTFARGLRSVLRQDPDVVLVGEIRDLETAELSMRASLTGHLVLASLHTNDAVSAINRLVDMGIEPYIVASSLSAVVAQRLVRTVCHECAIDDTPDMQALASLGLDEVPQSARPRRGAGCPRCEDSGFSGRRGVFEVVEVDAGLRRLMLDGADEQRLLSKAMAGGTTRLRDDALEAAARGETTYAEAMRMTVQRDVEG
jgi:type IV pilus assembly protein PilB